MSGVPDYGVRYAFYIGVMTLASIGLIMLYLSGSLRDWQEFAFIVAR